MSDPRHPHVGRSNHSSAFWGIVVVFVVAMLGLIAYGYHGIHGMQASSSGTLGATSGQGTREAPARVPTSTPQP
jgi:hypothetical protein